MILHREKLFEREHYSPMSGVLNQWRNISFLGQLENFDRDWKRISQMYSIDVNSFDKSLGEHITSRDPNHLRKNILKLFEEEAAYQRALCHLYLVDYTCLSHYYEVPSACAGITIPYNLECKNATILNNVIGRQGEKIKKKVISQLTNGKC